jgi:amidase
MATFPEYESFDGIGLADLVHSGAVSPAELVEAAIERIELHNPKINAVIHKMYDSGRELARGEIPAGAFQGVPFLLKDLLADYAGVPLTSGSHFTRNWIPQKDSALVTRIKKAGLITLGKTNVPEFGLSPVTESELLGPARNPWNLQFSPGGSSGGSAAAVASGMVPMAHANDGGGSIRIPAAYCGLFGMKPSRGRTATGSDFLRMWESMVVEHVLTRSVRDSAAMLDVLLGPELGATNFIPKPQASFLSCLEKPAPKLRIAMTDQPFFDATVHPEYIASTMKAAKLCVDLGHSVDSVFLKINSSEVSLAYVIVLAGEIAATIHRFSDKLKRKPKHRDLEKQTAVLANIGDHISAADFAWAGGVLEGASRRVAEFFQEFDVLITPTLHAPSPVIGGFKPDFFEQSMLEVLTHVPFAPLLRKAIEVAAVRNFSFYPFTPIFNITGQPAMSVPLYWDKRGMPIGIQFAARYGEEETLFQLARQLEEACPWKDKRAVLLDEYS